MYAILLSKLNFHLYFTFRRSDNNLDENTGMPVVTQGWEWASLAGGSTCRPCCRWPSTTTPKPGPMLDKGYKGLDSKPPNGVLTQLALKFDISFTIIFINKFC